jgi:molybdate transport system substrate-binding protein
VPSRISERGADRIDAGDPSMPLNLLCAGAAKGLVTALREKFAAATGADIEAAFGAVGAMREKLLAGAPCDAIVLTAAMIDDLAASGFVLPGTSAALGRVRTGIAVRAGESPPDISNAAALRAALQGATGIYFPDPARATAGIHFAGVLKRLGIDAEVATRLKRFLNGAAAMSALAQSGAAGEIGCTQITEIRYTPGVSLVGALPAKFELATTYTAAVCVNAKQPDLARRLVDLLAGPASRDLRLQGGFEG